MSIDIIVVNYRTPLDLGEFLASLRAFPPAVDATLTVVDVGTEQLDTFGGWDMNGREGRRIAVADNIGYARACNLAAASGKGDVIALFNADVVLTAHAIDRCHDELMAHDGWGVLGPRQVDAGNRIRHAGIFGDNRRPVHRGWAEIGRDQYLDTREAVTVSGSAYFVRRSVWQELTECPRYQEVAPGAEGAFLPTTHYYEETWCSYHARAHGYQVMYFGGVTIVHKWHQASPVGGWAERQVETSRAYFRAACDHHGIAHD